MKGLFTLCLILTAVALSAQARQSLDSIKARQSDKFQLYVAPGYGTSQLATTNASFFEFHAGLVYMEKLDIALRYATNLDNFQKQIIFPTFHNYSQRGIGLRAHYSFFKKDIKLHTGAGYQFVESAWRPEEESLETFNDYLGLAEFYVGITWSINRTFRLQGDAGYQLPNNVELVGFESSDFGGLKAMLAMKIAILDF